MRAFYRLSLSSRLTALALLALFPLAALIALQHLDERDARRRAGLGETTTFAQDVATAIDSFAAEIESFTDAAAITIGQEDEVSQESTGELIRSLTSRYPNLRAVFVTDLQGRVIVDNEGDNTGLDLSSRPYITELQAGAEKAWTHGIAGIQSGTVTASFSRVIRSPAGEPLAYLVAAFQPANLDDVFLPAIPDDGNLVLIDSKAQLFYGTRTTEGMSDLSAGSHVQTALGGTFAQVNDEDTIFDEGKRYGAVVPVASMGWAVGYTRSMGELTAAANAALLKDLAVLALIMAAVVVALFVIAREMTRSLKAISSAAASLAEGHVLDVPVSRTAAPEVRQLQQAFAGMAAAVKARETGLADQTESLRELEEAGATIAADLDLRRTVQAVTDAGTTLTEAEFGAFFYNSTDENGDVYLLHTLTGLQTDAFAGFPNPRATSLFGPTFRGEGAIRLADVTEDPRYGDNPPFNGMPDGHPPVRSYLAVPVIGSGNEVLGGLFFGHTRAGVFSEHHEALGLRIAAWASIALDNARLYEQAQHTQAELRRANVVKDEFLGMVSHELRTPVTTIYGGLKLLAKHKELLDSDQADEFIETMADEGARLVRLIEDLLVLARMELGREIEKVPSQVNGLVSEAVADFSRQRGLRQVELELAPDLPSIEVEPTYFRQVLTNLLSNADKYSPDELPIQVSTAREEDDVRIVVSDSGPGVPAEEVDKIFDSFFRSETTAGSVPGQGLGLTVCRKLVEAQQGKIWALNKATGGLEVGFSFQAMPPVDEGEQAAAAGVTP